jgi:DNA-binding transcriptional LysR family regulator
MELRHLRYFVAVAEEENISRAALKLRVSQPGLSRQVRDLEDEIGFQLFERSAKSIKLTAAGKTFMTEARAVLQRADDALKKARAVAHGGNSQIHVGYAPSLTVQILPQILRAFQGEFPHVRVTLHDLSSEEIMVQLGEKKLHLALTARPPEKMLRGLSFIELARYSFCVAVAPWHPLAKSRVLVLSQVAREPLIGLARKDYPDYYDDMVRLFAAVGHKPRIAEEHEGGSSLVAAIEAGRGIALVPSSLTCVVGERLKLIPLNPALPPILVGAIWLKKNGSALVNKFITASMPKLLG